MNKGYKKTELGKLPEEWEVRSLKEFVIDIKGGAPLRPNDFVKDNGFPVIPKKAIIKGGKLKLDIEEPTFCTTNFANAYRNNIVNRDYIITTLRDLVPSGPSIGYMVQFKDNKQYLLAQGVYGFRINSGLDKRFIIQYSNTVYFRKLMQTIMVGSTQVHIRNEDYLGITVPVPPLPEQQKIAEVLSTVDEKIDAIEEQIAATTELKQGLMQRLLTKGIGHTKFKSSPLGEIPESWEVVKLGDIYKNLSSGSTPSRRIPEYYSGDILWITSGELNYNIITETKEKITFEAVKDTNLKIHPPGTFFIAITGLEAAGTRGRCAINGVEATTNQSCMAFHANERIDTKYLFHYYKRYGSSLAFDYAQGTKQQSFNGKIVANILIKLPPATEQKEIAKILSAVETKVDTLKEKKVYYHELKQGLMQQLLTGKIRVATQYELNIA